MTPNTQVAATADRTNASCALGLVHGHEIRGDNAKALAAAKAFLSGNPQGGVGSRGLKNRWVFVLMGVRIEVLRCTGGRGGENKTRKVKEEGRGGVVVGATCGEKGTGADRRKLLLFCRRLVRWVRGGASVA